MLVFIRLLKMIFHVNKEQISQMSQTVKASITSLN